MQRRQPCCSSCSGHRPGRSMSLIAGAVFNPERVMTRRCGCSGLRVVFEHITTRAAQYVAGVNHGTPPRRSPRTTCSTTATRSSPAACARTIRRRSWKRRQRNSRSLPLADLGQRARFFTRHRRRAARRGAEGRRSVIVRRELLHRAGGTRDVCRNCSTPRARSTHSKPSRATTARHYGLPPNAGTVTLVPPDAGPCRALPFGDGVIKPAARVVEDSLQWKCT